MKSFYPVSILVATLFASNPVMAQISIDEVDAQQKEVTFRDEVKYTAVDVDYFSRARYKAERAAIRKERNTLEIGTGVQGALTSYNDPWISVSGGDNSIALTANLLVRHLFTKGLFAVETKFDGKIGYNRMKVETVQKDADGKDYTESNGLWFKNQDEFALSIAPSFKLTKHWSYGAMFKFRSQFVNGYKSRTEQKEKDLKSKFMTPGYLDISLGITYKSPVARFPIVVNLSPIAMSATYANSDWIRRHQVDAEGKEIKEAYNYGIEDPDKTSKYEGGSSVQIDFDRTFGKTGFLRYRTTIFSFFGWISDIGQKNRISDYTEYRHAFAEWKEGDKNIKTKPRLPIHPTVRWENTLDIKATKFLTTTLNFQLFYNRAQNVDVQTRTLLSVGLIYTFKNK